MRRAIGLERADAAILRAGDARRPIGTFRIDGGAVRGVEPDVGRTAVVGEADVVPSAVCDRETVPHAVLAGPGRPGAGGAFRESADADLDGVSRVDGAARRDVENA